MTSYVIKELNMHRGGKSYTYYYIYEQWSYRSKKDGSVKTKSRYIGKDTPELRARLGITNKRIDQAKAARRSSGEISKRPAKKKAISKRKAKT